MTGLRLLPLGEAAFQREIGLIGRLPFEPGSMRGKIAECLLAAPPNPDPGRQEKRPGWGACVAAGADYSRSQRTVMGCWRSVLITRSSTWPSTSVIT